MNPLALLLVPLVFLALATLGGLLAWAAPRRVAGVLLLPILALPWAVPAPLLPYRGAAALFAVVLFMRAVDLLGEPPSQSLSERVVRLFSVADLQHAREVPPRLDTRLLATGLACGGVAVPLLLVAMTGPAVWEAGALARRWGLGLAGFYLVFEGIDRSARAVYLLGGVEVEPTQRAPVAARSLTELWGLRWNAIVRRWLASVVFRPLARRGRPVVGGLLAFVVSAAIHFYIVLVPLGPGPAASMGGFFLVQGALVQVERVLGLRRIPTPLARVWTAAGILLPMPLFLEPLLRAMGAAALP